MRARSLAKDLGGIPKKKKSVEASRNLDRRRVGKRYRYCEELVTGRRCKTGDFERKHSCVLYRAEDAQRDSQNQTIGS